jgi:hypothetical protein
MDTVLAEMSLWGSTMSSCSATPGTTPTTTKGAVVVPTTGQNAVQTSGVTRSEGSVGATATSKSSAERNGRIRLSVIVGSIVGVGVFGVSYW